MRRKVLLVIVGGVSLLAESSAMRRRLLLVGVGFTSLLVEPANSAPRTWEEIATFHNQTTLYEGLLAEIPEIDALWFTSSPSSSPSVLPSASPTRLPSASPSASPTSYPTVSPMPSASPSISPTSLPSLSPSLAPTTLEPTNVPSASPSDPFLPNDLPDDIDSSYFNYNTKQNARYGPGYPVVVKRDDGTRETIYRNNGWKKYVAPDDFYWGEFDSGGHGPWSGVLSNWNPSKNRCDRVGLQSPIDLRENGAECEEHHQIRTRRGDYTLGSEFLEPQIQSNKLRLYFQRRPCRDLSQQKCAEPDDFPNNWGGYVDVLHVDFKIPSEHTIYGELFDAEMQIFHVHPGRRRTPAVSSLIRASANGYNPALQQILDQFQIVFNSNQAECARRKRGERRGLIEAHKLLGQNVTNDHIDFDSWADFSTASEAPDDKMTDRRHLKGIFTPYHPDLVTSIHFFGYEGSLTEPPCGEWVSWRVIDKPMKMSFNQLAQMKRIQFLNVNTDCERTSVQYDVSLARPIQDTAKRPVWRCTSNDYVADAFAARA